MRQYFELDPTEKKQERLMLTFAILSCLTIALGVYNQYHKIDDDYVLIPIFMTMVGTYFLVYGINGLTKGNLTSKWTPFYIFQFVFFLVKNIGPVPQERAKIISNRLLGALGLIISAGAFATAVITLFAYN